MAEALSDSSAVFSQVNFLVSHWQIRLNVSEGFSVVNLRGCEPQSLDAVRQGQLVPHTVSMHPCSGSVPRPSGHKDSSIYLYAQFQVLEPKVCQEPSSRDEASITLVVSDVGGDKLSLQSIFQFRCRSLSQVNPHNSFHERPTCKSARKGNTSVRTLDIVFKTVREASSTSSSLTWR